MVALPCWRPWVTWSEGVFGGRVYFSDPKTAYVVYIGDEMSLPSYIRDYFINHKKGSLLLLAEIRLTS